MQSDFYFLRWLCWGFIQSSSYMNWLNTRERVRNVLTLIFNNYSLAQTWAFDRILWKKLRFIFKHGWEKQDKFMTFLLQLLFFLFFFILCVLSSIFRIVSFIKNPKFCVPFLRCFVYYLFHFQECSIMHLRVWFSIIPCYFLSFHLI